MSLAPIDLLCRDLTGEFRRDPRGTRAAELLTRYAREHGDWREWARFDGEIYTRNLIHRCEGFELLLLCWGEGQASPIHDHDGQNCWMAVLEGTVEEVQYRRPNGGGGLVEGDVRCFEQGQVAYIMDEIGLHQVRPSRGRPGGRSVSLHLYSLPIDGCRVYDPRTGVADWAALGYHSVRGELCAGKSPESVRSEWAL